MAGREPRHGDPKAIHVDWEPRAAILAMEQMKPLEELAYRRILDLIYIHGNRLIDDDAELARMTKTGKKWPAIKKRLIDVHGKLYVSEDGFVRNEKCDQKLTEIGERIEQKRRAGRASAEARNDGRVSNDGKDLGSTPVATEGSTETQREGQQTGNVPNNPITHISKESKKKEIDRQFEAWWLLVPIKRAKDGARRAFERALKRASYDDLSAGIRRYAAEVAGSEPRYIKHPATWLNKGCWLDESAPLNRGNGSGRPAQDDLMAASARMDRMVLGGDRGDG